MKTSLKILLAASALMLGCNGTSDATLHMQDGQQMPMDTLPPVDQPPAINPPETTTPTNPTQNHCDFGRVYQGFAGTELTAGRIDVDLGLETARFKPYSALQTEYPRMLSNTPGLLASAGNTFAIIPARWYVEPQASAINLYTAYRIAFQGCLTATAGSGFNTAPTAATAATHCTTWAKQFWTRDPAQAEIDACVKVATVDTSTETNANRKWAYTCASVLSSADFLTY
ncbi:MAG: hypothetical protein QM723_36620 [Myxococcaceae bacterium]